MFKHRFGNWKILFGLIHIQDTYGLNSNLRDGNHILMWDFDKCKYKTVRRALTRIQRNENLSTIWLSLSSPGSNYHAICFERVSWFDCKRIIAATPWVDSEWYRGGVMRGYFTIRTGRKNYRNPEPIELLLAKKASNVSWHELVSWDRYETRRD